MTDPTTRADLLARLVDGVDALTGSAAWERHLEVQGRFPRYSYRNVLLIAMQRPDATRVAGFSAWRSMGRSVRKGERAIRILAPMLVRRDVDADDGVRPEGGERVLAGFKLVPVFDISQTDGDDLPAVAERLSGGDPAGSFAALAAAAGVIGFSVADHTFGGSTNGDCSHSERRIRIEAANAPAQRVKSLAHELAHAILHERYDSRALAELEAESTAYVLCNALGIDSGAYSFGYIASWAGGGESARAGIAASCTRIQRAASEILELARPSRGAAAA